MRRFKSLDGNCIIAIGTGPGQMEISETEYNEIVALIQSRPAPPEGYTYRLKTDLTCELHELPPVIDEPEPDTYEDYFNAMQEVITGT